MDEPGWAIPAVLSWPGEDPNGHDKFVIAKKSTAGDLPTQAERL